MKINPNDLIKLKNSGNYDRILNVRIFIGSKPVTEKQKNTLTKLGLANLTVKNNIIYGNLNSKLLVFLDSIDFVKYVEFDFDLDSKEISLLN